jgi:hypothetical protein
MAIDLIFSPANPNNPFEIARRRLISALARMPVPQALGSFPVPSDFEAIRKHVLEAASICDDWLGSIGHQVSDNATCNLDLRSFDAAFTGAVDGNATYEIEKAAETLCEAREIA